MPSALKTYSRGLPHDKDRDRRALRTAKMRARRAQLEAELGCRNGHFQRGAAA